MAYPYDPSRAALLAPARGAVFFPTGRPATEAALCAEMSRLAYAPIERDADAKRRFDEGLRRSGFHTSHFVHSGDTQGFLASDGSVTVLAFRGTEVDLGDWKTDLQAWPRSWAKGGKVHDGFASALALVWDDLLPRLSAAPGRRLYTGHSLGAALATLAASLYPPDALYTYGSPKVGDTTFLATVATVESHRYTNCCDVVCRIPVGPGYRHLGPAHYLNRKGGLSIAPDRGAVGGDHLRARVGYTFRYAWKPANLWTRDFADHAPINYYSALSQDP